MQNRIQHIFDKYGIVIAGLVIFLYYLWSALDMFQSSHERRTIQGFVFQFDSLILLWLLLLTGMKLHSLRKKQQAEQERFREIALEHEVQKMRLNLLDDVTSLLTDAIHNPLAVISISAGSIRERFASDNEIIGSLDRIEGALKRLREVLTEFHKYETKKILNPVRPAVAEQPEPQPAPGVR